MRKEAVRTLLAGHDPVRSRPWRRGLLVAPAGILLVAALAAYPLGAAWAVAALGLYALLVLAVPRAPLVLLPALLPVLDLAPLTGRFFLDEFDLLLLATLILGYCRPPGALGALRLSPLSRLLFGLFAASALLAAVLGALPPAWPDLNAFNNYASPYNGLRAAKGLFWCLLLFPLLQRELARDAAQVHRLFGIGMMLGVAAAALFVIRERIAFVGLFNFWRSYRVTGAFSAMHNGGAYIEAYFVLALPFVAWVALMQRQWLLRLFAIGVFLLGCYCLMVTYARGGYVALLIAMVALAAAIPFMPGIRLKPVQAALLAVLFGLMASVALPVLQGSYMQGRFATAERDFAARAAHWRQAIDMMDDRPATALFGMGSGRYPALSALAFPEPARPAGYRFQQEGQNSFLQLSPGLPLYFEQVVTVHPGRHYRVSLSARARDADATLVVPLCEKWLLYSATCFNQTVQVGDTGGQWRRFSFEIDTGTLAPRPWYAWRPMKFAMVNTGAAPLDVDNVSMQLAGQELLNNGGFERQMDHWYFSTDQFEAWHFENTWLQVYFEQGALGLALFVLLVLHAAAVSSTRLREAEFPLPPLGGAMLGFLALGTLDSLFDFPRLALLFYLTLAFILLKRRPA